MENTRVKLYIYIYIAGGGGKGVSRPFLVRDKNHLPVMGLDPQIQF